MLGSQIRLFNETLLVANQRESPPFKRAYSETNLDRGGGWVAQPLPRELVLGILFGRNYLSYEREQIRSSP
jgi:hypothetical protein